MSPQAAFADTEPAPPFAQSTALWLLWGAFWTIMIIVGLLDHLRAGVRIWEPLLWEGSSALAATFWFWMRWSAAPRYDAWLNQPARWFAHHLKWAPLVAATFIASVYGLRHGVYALLGERYVHEPWPMVIVYESIKLMLFVGLWLGVLFGYGSFEQWRRERRRLLLLEKSLAQAQLAQLKAQLRPHFLFNALNTISALMHEDPGRADRLLARLSELLRATLQGGERHLSDLQEELRLLELFAQIMQERFPDRVRIEWRVDPAVLHASVPAMLLQPLLENAFKHGVEKSRDPVAIEICVSRDDSRLHLAVRNSGALQPASREGVGLRNCRERLRVTYGEDAHLTLAEEHGFVAARIAIPLGDSARA